MQPAKTLTVLNLGSQNKAATNQNDYLFLAKMYCSHLEPGFLNWRACPFDMHEQFTKGTQVWQRYIVEKQDKAK